MVINNIMRANYWLVLKITVEVIPLIRHIIHLTQTMKTKITQLVGGLALLGLVVSASAQSTITYTETGFLTGSLGGIDFSNAAVTVTAVGNSANIVYYPNVVPGVSLNNLACANVTVQIAGFSLATLTGDVYGVQAENFYNTSGGTYITDFTMNGAYIWGNGNTSPSYDLSTAATFTDFEIFNGVPFSTDQGAFLITAAAGNGLATFNAVVESTPEPSKLALSTMGWLALLLKFRRRK